VLPAIWPSGHGAFDALHDGIHVFSIVLEGLTMIGPLPQRLGRKNSTRTGVHLYHRGGLRYDFPAHGHIELTGRS